MRSAWIKTLWYTVKNSAILFENRKHIAKAKFPFA
jgi:hypothetical protein